MVWQSLEAARSLAKEGIAVDLLNIHTIKPLDDEAILKSVSKTGCLVTAEEHQRNGGLGSCVANLLGSKLPTPQELVAVNDSFGESGKPTDLLDKYGLSVDDVIAAAKRAIARK